MAVTGASGSGKTTLSKLLMGFYKPDSGMIEVCGNNLDDISLAAGRSFFALVPQDAILFNMSIMDNIRMGRLDATEAEIIKAAKMANAHQNLQMVMTQLLVKRGCLYQVVKDSG